MEAHINNDNTAARLPFGAAKSGNVNFLLHGQARAAGALTLLIGVWCVPAVARARSLQHACAPLSIALSKSRALQRARRTQPAQHAPLIQSTADSSHGGRRWLLRRCQAGMVSIEHCAQPSRGWGGRPQYICAAGPQPCLDPLPRSPLGPRSTHAAKECAAGQLESKKVTMSVSRSGGFRQGGCGLLEQVLIKLS